MSITLHDGISFGSKNVYVEIKPQNNEGCKVKPIASFERSNIYWRTEDNLNNCSAFEINSSHMPNFVVQSSSGNKFCLKFLEINLTNDKGEEMAICVRSSNESVTNFESEKYTYGKCNKG